MPRRRAIVTSAATAMSSARTNAALRTLPPGCPESHGATGSSRPGPGSEVANGRHDMPADPSEGLEHLDMVPGDVAHHHVLEAHRMVLPELLHHCRGTADEQRVPARPAITLGEDRVHDRGRFGVAIADEDVAAQHGQGPPAGASRRLAICLELLLQIIQWSVLAREPAVAQASS